MARGPQAYKKGLLVLGLLINLFFYISISKYDKVFLFNYFIRCSWKAAFINFIKAERRWEVKSEPVTSGYATFQHKS